MMLTLVGEFVVKNLVLLAAGLVVASRDPAGSRRTRPPERGGEWFRER